MSTLTKKMRMSRASTLASVAGLAALLAMLSGCPLTTPNGPDDSGDGDGDPKPITSKWQRAFDDSRAVALSSVWGSGPSDVFIVGGTAQSSQVLHYDGGGASQSDLFSLLRRYFVLLFPRDGVGWTDMNTPDVPLLVWAYGFSPTEVYSVGVRGAAARWDGGTWHAIKTPWRPNAQGVSNDLWGIWGASPGEMWVVGGRPGVGPPVLARFDGQNFVNAPFPDNDRNATALFKIWGIGSKVFAVGERGLILQYDGESWFQVFAGPDADEDFVSLWGVDENNIVAVGGRSSARIAIYDGARWRTIRPPGVPGLNGVFMLAPDLCVIGGQNGFVGTFNPQTEEVVQESSPGTLEIHAVWGDGAGRVYAVGGRFSPPFQGLALVRTAEGTDPVPLPPAAGTNAVDNSALTDDDDDDGGDPDPTDQCPDDPQKTEPGICGCGVPDIDSDGDGVPDCLDGCPDDPNKTEPGDCGCGVPDIDSDGDGVPDCLDGCPNDANKTAPGVCGCNNPDLVADDGTIYCIDLCPDDPDKFAPGVCGCGVPDIDSDGDGIPDCIDPCPTSADHTDCNFNGIIDDCECFVTDCPLGQVCGPDGACVPAAIDILLEQPDDPDDPFTGPHSNMLECGTHMIICGPQGWADEYIRVRLVGFAQGARVDITHSLVTLTAAGVEDTTLAPNQTFTNFPLQFDANTGISTFNFARTLPFAPPTFDGRRARLRLKFVDRADPAIEASIEMHVWLDAQGVWCAP